jgi:hypothetical protein
MSRTRVAMSFALLTLMVILAGCHRGGGSSGTRSPETSSFDSAIAAEWFDLLYDLVRDERLSPPVASRVYGCAGVTLYEAVVPGMRRHRSLAGQINGLSSVPAPDRRLVYDWPTVANGALASVLAELFRNGSAATLAAIADERAKWVRLRGFAVSDEVLERSLAQGETVSAAILEWAGEDGFAQFDNCAYTEPAGDGLWERTPPAFAPALQPCWGSLRPFVLAASDECDPGPHTAYSSDPDSAFFAEALEVYDTANGLDDEQREIAIFWADGPGDTGTPSGHWISILGQILAHDQLSLAVAAEGYARVGIAVADAFISCWEAKYRYNLLRPITFIQDFIDPSWQPPLGTPPFPEYTSGHSVQSGASAAVLTDLLGEVPFLDTTHEDRGLAARSFSSFNEAAEEAAVSRLYGGIHFRPAIDVGVDQGRCIAERILERVRFRR